MAVSVIAVAPDPGVATRDSPRTVGSGWSSSFADSNDIPAPAAKSSAVEPSENVALVFTSAASSALTTRAVPTMASRHGFFDARARAACSANFNFALPTNRAFSSAMVCVRIAMFSESSGALPASISSMSESID